MTDWLSDAFPLAPYQHHHHPPGEKQMLTIVAYDIADPRRLVRVARVCEDFGVRVQYSVFECRLEADRFEEFWIALQLEIDPDEDRLVAYKVCAACARDIQTAGCMVCSEKAVAYVF
jgi:CRISPR-associated protein Cas2